MPEKGSGVTPADLVASDLRYRLAPLDQKRYRKAVKLVTRKAEARIFAAEQVAVANGQAYRLLGPTAKLLRKQYLRRLAKQTVAEKLVKAK